MKRHIVVFCVAILLLLSLTLSSCSSPFIRRLLGIKNTDYESEAIIGSAMNNAEIVSKLTLIVSALTVNSNALPEFSDAASAVRKCGDAVLNYMLTTNYARYHGNKALLEKAEQKYPGMNITAAIGISNYENELYSLFNYGEAAKKADTERFRYLPKISAYIPAAQAQANETVLDITSLDETVSAYKMTFYCISGDNVSKQYYALFVKRDDGGCYIKTLRSVAGERVNAPNINGYS